MIFFFLNSEVQLLTREPVNQLPKCGSPVNCQLSDINIIKSNHWYYLNLMQQFPKYIKRSYSQPFLTTVYRKHYLQTISFSIIIIITALLFFLECALDLRCLFARKEEIEQQSLFQSQYC